MVQEEAEERVEIGEMEESTPAELSVDPTLNAPAGAVRYYQSLGRGGRQRALNRPQSGLAQQAAQLASRGNYAVPAAQADDQTQIFSFFAGFNNGGSGNQPANGNGLFTTDLNMPFAQGTYALNVNGGNFYTGGTNITGGDLNNLIAQNQKDVFVVDKSGMCRSVRLADNGKLGDKQAAAMAAEFNSSGAILLSCSCPRKPATGTR